MKSAIIEAADFIEDNAGYFARWGQSEFCLDRSLYMSKYDKLMDLAQRLRAEASGWQPIETAPTDNKRPLYLARFNEAGELQELDWDGSWESGSESWEIPEVYYYWGSNNGIEEPTHWAYQDGPPPTVKP